jgi:hypothetical protein
MVRDRKRWLVPGLAVAAALAAAWIVLGEGAPANVPAPGAATEPVRAAGRGEPDVPRIDLARLDRARSASGVGRRDLFDFAVAAAPPAPRMAAMPRVAAVETPPPPPAYVAPTPPPLAPLNIKYIGAFEGRRGLKVAVLMTDRKEVLTGQPGEVVANRYRIVRVGLESVDVQEVGSDQVRRIPLKGN